MSNQKGNVLFVILLAVALFAALSYAVSSSTRSNTSNISKDEADIQANRLLNFAAQAAATFQRLQNINNCDFYAISNTDLVTTPGPCNIFDIPRGGALVNPFPPSDKIYGTYTNPPYPGKAVKFHNSMYVRNIGTNLSEIAVFVFNIKPEICNAINKRLRIITSDGQPPLQTSPYEGGWFNPLNLTTAPNYGWLSMTIGLNNSGVNELTGQRAGCYQATRSGYDMGYHFYNVIIDN